MELGPPWVGEEAATDVSQDGEAPWEDLAHHESVSEPKGEEISQKMQKETNSFKVKSIEFNENFNLIIACSISFY